jgi:hypothetical protein
MGEREQPVSEDEFENSSAAAASRELSAISSQQYREFANEWKHLARTVSSDHARELSLKMMNIWLEAAMRCEAGLPPRYTERG